MGVVLTHPWANLMNRPSSQRCLAKTVIDDTSLWWFNRNAYGNEIALYGWTGHCLNTRKRVRCRTRHTRTHRWTDGQYTILSLAWFTEPLPDNWISFVHLLQEEQMLDKIPTWLRLSLVGWKLSLSLRKQQGLHIPWCHASLFQAWGSVGHNYHCVIFIFQSQHAKKPNVNHLITSALERERDIFPVSSHHRWDAAHKHVHGCLRLCRVKG